LGITLMNDETLLLSLESIQNILIDYATGGDADEDEFKRLRRQVVQNPRVKTICHAFSRHVDHSVNFGDS